MQNRYPAWKYILIVVLLLIGLLYAAPNLFGDDPAVQISAKTSAQPDPNLASQIATVLQNENLKYLSISKQDNGDLLVRFSDTDTQLKARDDIKAFLGEDYIVAINLAPRTPKWLLAMGAYPMKLGLDLRGGVHFLMDVDVDALVKTREESDIRNFSQTLRAADIRYTNISLMKPTGIAIDFLNAENLNKAKSLLVTNYPDYAFGQVKSAGNYELSATITQAALVTLRNYAVDQTITILNSRVNQLGVSEAVVQRQGASEISVDLPGIQDTARAKDLIGKQATLKFQLVDMTHDANIAASTKNIPLDDQLYEYEGRPILLKSRVILRGSAITYASANIGENGQPAVQVRLGGDDATQFYKTTGENVGKLLAVVYVDTQMQSKMIDGKPIMVGKTSERVISVATIQSALGTNFQITNLDNMKYAQNLALLLRSGAYQAPVGIVQERTVGPSLGKANIHKGVMSLVIGSVLVIIFMLLYYRLFGLIADLALILNVIFIVAILSILHATLTLSGIAGIVLTVGMAVDANVLINERIREELRNGMSPQASIAAGYERAFSTIVDANVTTLIVAVILFALGSGTVKGFAVTLTVGLLTSMLTAIFFTRGLVNLIYGKRRVSQLSIGIRPRSQTKVK